ncbi:N-succinylarginine dihydrolase [Vibrio sp. PP-XX7]
MLAQQNPAVIDQGVFHNDVIAVSNGPVLFHHQEAFLNTQTVFDETAKLTRIWRVILFRLKSRPIRCLWLMRSVLICSTVSY